MNDLIEKENIESMIYEIRRKQVMLDSEIAVTKCQGYLYDKIVTHYDIGKSISLFNNFIIGGKIIWN